MHPGRLDYLADAFVVTPREEDEVVFGQGEVGRCPCVRFADAACLVGLVGDHVVVGGFGFVVGAEESADDPVQHL